MKSAYLYVRVSTDEQKRKGYSLVEQEDRLLQHCEVNNIKVKGIFREDFSAKDFNRPEWKKLINTIKRTKHHQPENILFVKWDRFSRNIEYAYQMIRLLRNLNVKAMSIDQPIDFEVPESIVMLAIYLSIPEAENSRRGLNSSDGMRRAKKMGRWPGKAPIGYANVTALDGKKFIIPQQPEANHIRWSFQQLAKGSFTISQVREMAFSNGFRCGKSNFWKLIRNPVYCGIVTVPANKNEELQFVKAIHEPLISEDLFHDVQIILNGNRKQRSTKENLRLLFPLRGSLICPWCHHKLTGSISQGKRLKYRYYHCMSPKCKGRFRADALDRLYEDELKKVRLIPEAYELFNLVLEDENIFSRRKEQSNERKVILDEISNQEFLMSKARNYFLNEKIDFDDFCKLKKEHYEISSHLNIQLNNVTTKLMAYRNDDSIQLYSFPSIFQSYNNQDIEGKRKIISLFSPSSINPFSRTLEPLTIDKAISKIINYSRNED